MPRRNGVLMIRRRVRRHPHMVPRRRQRPEPPSEPEPSPELTFDPDELPDSEPQSVSDLQSMTVRQLKNLAIKKQVKGLVERTGVGTRVLKADWIELLKDHYDFKD